VLTFYLNSLLMKFTRRAPLDQKPRRLSPLALVVAFSLTCAIVFGSPAKAQNAPAQDLAAQQIETEGRRVNEVSVVDEKGETVAEHLPALSLKAGEAFDFAQERDSLRALYRTGDYAEIRVTATDVSGGVDVSFIVIRNYFNNTIRIEKLKPPPTEAAALASLRLALGEPFRESALREGIARLEDSLRTEGLYSAQVTSTLSPHEDTRQMDITITIDPGFRALVGDIELKNQTPYSDDELIRRSKLTPKNSLTSSRLARASQRLKKFLVDQGYLSAGVVITPGDYNSDSKRVPLSIQVTAGPRVRVQATGAHLSKDQLRKLLPIFAEGAVDEDLLQEGRRNIRDFFQREGYFDADVQFNSHDSTEGGGERVITYQISRGERFRLANVSFEGNKYFSTSLLAGRLQLQPASFASRGRFSQRIVQDDADSIRGLYLSNGFLNSKVTSSVDDNYQGKKGNLHVSFSIIEGAQTLVASLKIDGNYALTNDSLLAIVGSTAGQPYSDASVASDRNNILAIYYNEGFPGARFQEVVSPPDATNRVQVVYHITEGPRIEVSQVLLSGYQFTRPGIISRQVRIQAGGPLREGDVVDTQHRLYNLGVFNRVQIAPQNPAGTDPDKTVVVNVEEGGRYTIAYGGGFEVQRLAGGAENPNGTIIAASPRGIFEISRSNMFGRAQTLTFRVRASTLQYRSLLSYTADNFLEHRKLSLQILGFADKTQDINTFTSIRYEGAVQLIGKISPTSSLQFQYFYRHVEIPVTSLRIDPEEVPLLSQPTRVSGFGATYVRDRRDNPADAKRGMFNSVDMSVAAKSFGSSASFFRAVYQNSSFYPFGRAFVFARSVRFGVEETLDGTAEMDVPLPERLFAGGGSTLRGFGLNQAGPRDPVTGFPIGGLALLAFNQELRFPMSLPYVGNRLGGTLFYDAGNVYTDVNHVSFAWKPPSPANLDYFSHTVGFGVRYPTPIGPVRLDFGYQLNPAQYQVMVTNPTTGTTQTELFRLPHFQFFFNIGPVF
jgi:outer membrane protein insertion porin family